MNINTDITINQIIESSIYFTATVSTFWILFRQWLRFSVKKTLGLAAVFVFIDDVSALLTPFGSGWILSIIFLVDAAAEIQLVKWGYRRKACILYEIQCLLFNILGIAIIAALTALYGMLMGRDSQTWFLDETATQADYIIKYIGMIIGYMVSFWITKKMHSPSGIPYRKRSMDFFSWSGWAALAVHFRDTDLYGGFESIYGRIFCDTVRHLQCRNGTAWRIEFGASASSLAA